MEESPPFRWLSLLRSFAGHLPDPGKGRGVIEPFDDELDFSILPAIQRLTLTNESEARRVRVSGAMHRVIGALNGFLTL